MSNPYGITLDREWTEWAADMGVSHTVAAALLLICQGCAPDEIVARLTRGELEQVGEIVGRCPNHFPPGTFRRPQEPRPNAIANAIKRQRLDRSSAQSAGRADQREKFAQISVLCAKTCRSPFRAPTERYCSGQIH
jgi:hypothetical protein